MANSFGSIMCGLFRKVDGVALKVSILDEKVIVKKGEVYAFKLTTRIRQ